MSAAFIRQRTQLVSQNYQWYQKIDNSFFKLYNALRTVTDRIYAPFSGIYKELNSAYDAINVDTLPENVAKNFTAYISRINSTIWSISLFQSRMALSQFGMMMMGPDFTSPPTNNFRNSLQGIGTLVMRLTTSVPYGVSDDCVVATMSQIVPTYRPYAEQIVNLADVAINAIPTVFSNATITASNTFIELRSLIAKIKACAKNDALKSACVDNLVSYINA